MEDDYVRVLVGQMFIVLAWMIAREKFGKAYDALSEEQQVVVANMAYNLPVNSARAMTPEHVRALLAGTIQGPPVVH